MSGQKRTRGQGRIYQRGGVWWCAYYRNGKEIRESAETTDEGKAQKYLDAQREEAKTPRFVSPEAKRLRFEDLCELLRRDYARKRNRSRLESKLARLAEVFAGDRALDITTDRVDRYIEARVEAKVRPATINRELAA